MICGELVSLLGFSGNSLSMEDNNVSENRIFGRVRRLIRF